MKELTLNPKELFYLGTLLRAKYIDYTYVSAMEDIGQNYPLFENETKSALTSAGVIMEDFGGNVEISSDVVELLNPIFFGETETTVEVCKVADNVTISLANLHFFDGKITLVTMVGNKFYIKPVSQIDVRELSASLVPSGYDCTEAKKTDAIKPENVDEYIVCKSSVSGKSPALKAFVLIGGVFYEVKGETDFESVSGVELAAAIYDAIKGE